MLSNFFADVKDAANNFGLCSVMQNCSDLPMDASAQWYAGLLYAFQYQEEDHRDYIVECSYQRDDLDHKLEEAFGDYNDEKYKDGNQMMRSTENLFRKSMVDCCDT